MKPLKGKVIKVTGRFSQTTIKKLLELGAIIIYA